MNKNSGFTLIEVLITMTVMALGLLGLAGLQMTGLKNNQSAYNRSQATQLAYDMADKIRTNSIDSNNGDDSTYITKEPTAAVVQTDCTTVSTTCTTADMAENDLYLWNQAITTTLPSGSGIIEVNGTVYTITIKWDDDRDGSVDEDDSNNIPDDPSFKLSFLL